MKKTKIFIVCCITALAVIGVGIFGSSKWQANHQVSTQASSQTSSSSKAAPKKENPTIKRALKEFASVEDFDQHFNVNVTDNGSNFVVNVDSYIISARAVTGKGGWFISEDPGDKVLAEQQDEYGNVQYTIRGDDSRGTTIGEIEAAFAARDSGKINS